MDAGDDLKKRRSMMPQMGNRGSVFGEAADASQRKVQRGTVAMIESDGHQVTTSRRNALEDPRNSHLSPATRLKMFLEESCGSTLSAWINIFDTDNDQRISKKEFGEGMRKLNFAGKTATLFAELDDDGSGEITMNEIDEEQNTTWVAFRAWCVATFKAVDDMMLRLGQPLEGTQGVRTSVVRLLESVTLNHFTERVRQLGWTGGDEYLIFTAMDSTSEGILRPSGLQWLGIELLRMHKKNLAKSKAASSFRKAQNDDHLQKTFAAFKVYLRKKYGNLVRAWRVVLNSHDSMVLPKPQFLKACAKIGFARDAKDIWKVLDKDDSGFASLDELDPKSAELLAHFKMFFSEKFHTAHGAFAAMDPEGKKKLSAQAFEAALHRHGWKYSCRPLFHQLDKAGRGHVELNDLSFLESWSPLPYLLSKANDDAKEEVRRLLLMKFHRYLKAWRHLLDRDGSNRCNWHEFTQACKSIGYSGDIAGAWRSFDEDLSGYITLKEVDAEAYDSLVLFRTWAMQEFGNVKSAFAVFDDDNSNQLTFQEFRGALRVYGFRGDAKHLFNALDTGGEDKTLSLKEVAFLDEWVLEEDNETSQKKETVPEQGPSSNARMSIRNSLMHPTGSSQAGQFGALFSHLEDPSKEEKTWKQKVDDPMRLVKVKSFHQERRRRSLAVTSTKISTKRRSSVGAMDSVRVPPGSLPEVTSDGEEARPTPRESVGLPRHAVERKDRERRRLVKDQDQESVKQLWLNYQSNHSRSALHEALLRGMEYDVTHIGGPLTAREVKMARQSLLMAVAHDQEADPHEDVMAGIVEQLPVFSMAKPSLDELLQIPRVGPEYLLASVQRETKAKRMLAESRVASNKSSMARLPSIPKLRLEQLKQEQLPQMPHTVR
mmetsp:Transcript_97461/g.173578  ORF Transcript_97461/g.173578 Transcript_97461/m.173578 type:complete len:884 (+) Transcript_97461:111-2762(+)|eukprot:CAMPEP_0197621892 /NCGR_PEP_ID=MMETSP1338-20131121/2322_1 /TAXON_ID=43686 ORGANISM="Pelagodinium beii, Strain RCC1491" /NCGR_SAMPLE_ID=MMETSP1338 /ASSEMBLY_ACC=CAM_ASM_000754 /LENGTH=883 /DNA_ID=CAMNT_0043191465 /DNA_START=42 /DNA_END=2693 /DNA_ORIENTATION=-